VSLSHDSLQPIVLSAQIDDQEFRDLAVGTYTISVEAKRFNPATRSVALVRAIDLTLHPRFSISPEKLAR